MIYRVLIGAGLFMLGYYVGREVKRVEPIRRQLREAREEKEVEERPVQHTARPIPTEEMQAGNP